MIGWSVEGIRRYEVPWETTVPTLLRRLLSRRQPDPPSKNDLESFRVAISIDVTGPEFFDFYPTAEDIAARLRASAQFRDDAISWISEDARAQISEGGQIRGVVERIVRHGTLLDSDAVAALGFHRKAKVGERYVAAIAGNDARAATQRLERSLHVACSRALHLHNLRRMAELGVEFVTFSSAKDERSTPLERELEGTTLSIEEARALAIERSDDISRSTFRAQIDF